MGSNDFLERQKKRDKKFFDAGMMFGLQLENDFYQMTLNDKSIMGSRVLGRAMIEKIAAHTSELDEHFQMLLQIMWRQIFCKRKWTAFFGKFLRMTWFPLQRDIRS